MAKIIEAEIRNKKRRPMPEGMFDPTPEVWVKVEGETEAQYLFSYYPDELSFTESEFIGLTVDEAHDLRRQKDIAYLRS